MRPMRYPWKFSVFLMVYYMANALFQGYLSLYYVDCGFNSAQIGTIFACVALISIAAQPFWGIRSDRAKSKNRVLNGLALASGAIAGAFLFVKSFAALLLLACAFAFFYTSLQPLGDAVGAVGARRSSVRTGAARGRNVVCSRFAGLWNEHGEIRIAENFRNSDCNRLFWHDSRRAGDSGYARRSIRRGKENVVCSSD